MKRILAGLLAALLALAGVTAAAEGYRAAEDNAENLSALLTDLVNACTEASEEAVRKIDDDLAAVRAVSETDYEIASAIAAHWKSVYLDPDYALFMHSGGQRATELEQAGLKDGDIQAIVVLGYELENGEMTDELKGRCEAAAAAARSFPSAILVCSGGATGENNPENHTEAGMMKEYLAEQCGIDADRILIDESAMTTVENAVNTFEMLRERDIRTMTIVTSAYHQKWGQAVYNAVGAICRLEYGYAVEIVGNYCFDTEPSNPMLRMDSFIASRQLAQILNLPHTKPSEK